ncbi:MAG: restriction endonuclease [Allisonella histaminiformans]|uniref:McrB family protein n=1 Tax=Allisonella histaminiformans TaxID=209880 RepID=UPI002A7F871A|nr:restriction endonuclease [Allisonella histaminiformans]MDY4540702.1 restriction endonuclease [Allisonella histaminiformans]
MNKGNEKMHLLQGEGRVLGYIRKGVKISRPGEGKTDYRFFMEPLSPLPPDFQEARERGYGFTGFMNELGYPINAFPNEEAAEAELEKTFGNAFFLFTPGLKNDKYFVVTDLVQEYGTTYINKEEAYLPIPVFGTWDKPLFDGDMDKLIAHLLAGKPLPGLGKKQWVRTEVPQMLVIHAGKDDSGKQRFLCLMPQKDKAFKDMHIGQGGAYFHVKKENLSWAFFYADDALLVDNVVRCHHDPLWFIPQSVMKEIRKQFVPLLDEEKPENQGAIISQQALDQTVRDMMLMPASSQSSDEAGRNEQPEIAGKTTKGKTAETKDTQEKVKPPVQKNSRAEEDGALEKEGTAEKTEEKRENAASEKSTSQEKSRTAALKAEKVMNQKEEKKAKEEKREDEEMAFIHRFIRRVKERGFLYDERDLYNFHISAKSSRLVILAGRSGTGKSGLVRLYGETLGLSPSQIAFLPVRPSWMDDGDLLGYLDRNRMLYFPSDTGLAELLVNASRHPEKMYIVCFDEMNLARAEYYFAQFISVLEKRENPSIQLYNPSLEDRVYNHSDYPARIPVLDNVLFMGTVNVDESTYHFSDKILDRANVITLHQRRFADMARLSRKHVADEDEVGADVYRRFRKEEQGVTMSDAELHLLDSLNAALDERGASGGIGYRVVSDMSRYLANIPSDSPMSRKEALDMQIVQRVLTKVRGSREQIGYLVSLDEENRLTGRFPELLNRHKQVSAFTESMRVLKRKAKELKTYDYTL